MASAAFVRPIHLGCLGALVLKDLDILSQGIYNLDLNQVASAITNANLLVVTGTTEASSGAFDIELPGELQGVKSLEDLPIVVDGNSIIRFSDIAEVRDTFKDASNYARVHGQPSGVAGGGPAISSSSWPSYTVRRPKASSLVSQPTAARGEMWCTPAASRS